MFSVCFPTDSDFPSILFLLNSSARSIRLAIDTKNYDVLPAAFYELVINAWRADRSLDVDILNREELRCMVLGQKKIQGRFNPGGDNYISSLLLRLPPLPCPNDLECLDGLIQWLHALGGSFPGFTSKGLDPLAWILEVRKDLEYGRISFKACDACKTKMCSVFNSEREQVWGRLGEYFELVSEESLF